jgi:hypothetical protein
MEWLTNLTEPIRAARDRLDGLVERVRSLEGELESKAA